MAAEQRRSRKRNQPAPVQALEQASPTVIPEKVCRPARARASSSRLRARPGASRASTDSPRRGALAPTAAASTGWAAPKRPSSSSVHRKREFGGGGPPTSGAGGSSGGAISWPSAERRGFGARGAQRRNRRQQPRPAPGRRNADAAQIDVDRPPVDDEAHALETRRLADGKRRRQMAQPPRARSLAAQQPGFERVRVADREQREHRRARRDDPRRREQRSPAAHCRRASRAAPAARRKSRLSHAAGPRVRGRMAAASGSKSALMN